MNGSARELRCLAIAMPKGRLEAFSDGVIAIIITIMVLELEAPEGATIDTLAPLLPVFATYIVSFVFLGIYWNNLAGALRHRLGRTPLYGSAADCDLRRRPSGGGYRLHDPGARDRRAPRSRVTTRAGARSRPQGMDFVGVLRVGDPARVCGAVDR
jgi:hypothetical protein